MRRRDMTHSSCCHYRFIRRPVQHSETQKVLQAGYAAIIKRGAKYCGSSISRAWPAFACRSFQAKSRLGPLHSAQWYFYFEMFRWYRSIQAVMRKSRNNNGNNSSVYLEFFNDTDCFGMISFQESRGSIGWALTDLVALIHGKLRAVPLM